MASFLAHSPVLERRFLVIAITCLMGILLTTILLHEMASSSSQYPPMITLSHSNDDGDDRANTNNTSPTNGSYKGSIPLKHKTASSCPPYGCQIYPIELPIIKQEVSQTDDDGDGKLYAAFSQRGRDHVINQDRGILLLPPPEDEDQDTNGWQFSMGIFDGHGAEGHHVAQHLQQNLFQKLHEKLVQKEEMESALTDTFIELDRELDDTIGNDGGSTSALVLRRGSVLYFASVGDSLCLFSDERGDILFQTRYDKAHMPEERERILQMGGKIHTPPQHPKQARSVAFNKKKKEMMSLAMSRAIGDWEHLGVVARPHVDVVEIPSSGGRGFVACGSDGMFEARQPQFIARQLAEHGVTRTTHLIELATPKMPNAYHDDITLIAFQIVM